MTGNRASQHVVIDARMVEDGGIGTYITSLVPRIAQLRPDWRFTVLGNPERIERAGLTVLANVDVVAMNAGIYGFREQIELAARTPADATVFWAPHYNIPLLVSTPLVVTIHDVCHLAVPEDANRLRRAYAQFMLGAVRRRARRILFDSKFSAAEMTRYVGAARATQVTHLAMDDDWFDARERYADRPLTEPYLVYVGNMKKHKNVPMLIRAFLDVQHRIPHRLVLIGRSTGLRADPGVADALRGADGRVIMAGEVPRERLQQFVSHADATLTASLYEGFGLPALEAMAAGCACMVSNAGSLPEICGDAALVVDPRDRAAIAAGIVRVATDATLRETLVARGRARARRFSWDACAESTVAALTQGTS